MMKRRAAILDKRWFIDFGGIGDSLADGLGIGYN